MKIVISTCLMALTMTVICRAEPPAPRYLPPGRGGGSSSFGSPSSQYGAPSSGPSQDYSAPSAPSQQYGAPNGGGQTQAVFGNKPSSNYGAPSRPSQNYGAPSPSQNYGAPSSNYLPSNQGYGNGNGHGNGDENNEPANYNFEYMVKDEQSGNDFGHKESRQGDRAEGVYYVLLPDGRKQIVTYEADEQGYRPKITYEDVGAGGGYGRGPANGGYSSGSNQGGYSSSNGGYSSGGPQGPY